MSQRQHELTIGTISFERCRSTMLLKPRERLRLIKAAVDVYAPDFLVTAGYALHSRKQLHRLAAYVEEEEPSVGTIITEVHHDGHSPRAPGRTHSMWAIASDGDLHRTGRQAFATSAEADAPGGERLARFRESLNSRVVDLGRHTAFCMMCGELNVVRGRDRAKFIDAECERVIMGADMVINPTHDRMSHAGTLDAKRRLLSRPHPDGRPRAYITCSNWEACGRNGRVQYPSPTLHTVYVSGQPIPYEELADGAFGFVYRRWRLPL